MGKAILTQRRKGAKKTYKQKSFLFYFAPLRLCVNLLFFFFITSTVAQSSSYVFSSTTQQQQFQTLTEQLRCLVCQNESLSDSQAPLAKDLRAEIYQKVKAGESEEAIKKYLVTRYGQFILFKPTFNAATYMLWLVPFILLICGFTIVVFVMLRSKR